MSLIMYDKEIQKMLEVAVVEMRSNNVVRMPEGVVKNRPIVDKVMNDEHMMKEEMEKMKEKKMKTMIKSDCKLKDYVKTGTLYSVRKTWEARSYMLPVAGNYPGYTKYQGSGWLCQACSLQVREDQDHLALCPGYTDLLVGKDINIDSDLIEFFRLVMARKEKEGWN